MTVCVAGIWSNQNIVAASDRMITAGGILEFEPQNSKIWTISPYCIVLVAGDITIHDEIIGPLKEWLSREGQKQTIKTIAEKYCGLSGKLRSNRVEREILGPFNMTFESWLQNQVSHKEQFVKDIENAISQYSYSISALICGIDQYGPHIYLLEGSELTCRDRFGFCAIGIGAQHALTHLMLSAYSSSYDLPKAMLLIHQAKKNAEVAPGVGIFTDMAGIFVAPTESDYKVHIVTPELMKELDECYEKRNATIEKINELALVDLGQRIVNLAKKGVPGQPQNPISPPTTPESPSKGL